MYRKEPWHNSDGMGFLAVAMLIFFVVIIALVVVCARPAPAEDGKVVVTVRDFGRGMTPILPPFANDPSAIVLSQNMYSTQPGSRQIRFGFVQTVPSADSNLVDSVHGIDAMAYFTPASDSGSLLYACGGKWYYTAVGIRKYRYQLPYYPYYFIWLAETLQVSSEIRPLAYGDSVSVKQDSLTVYGYGTRFTRDLAPGDTIILGAALNPAWARRVAHVISDRVLTVDSAWQSNNVETGWGSTRSYDTTSKPFIMQSGDYAFTGTGLIPTQSIHTKPDKSGLYLRELQAVDSFYIDDIINVFSDSLRSNTDTTGLGQRMIREIQLVSRRKPWQYNQWSEGGSGNSQAYFVRLGFGDSSDVLDETSDWRTRFYPINGNTDTSIILRTWYVDSLITDTTGDSVAWVDSIFQGLDSPFPLIADTIKDSQIVGTWGYIYNAAGNEHTILPDDSTPTATLLGRGAVWVLTGSNASLIDPETFYDGMYWLHLTGDDISFPAFRDSSNTHVYYWTSDWYGSREPRPKPPGVDDSLIISWTIERGGAHGTSRRITYAIYTNLPLVTSDEFLTAANGYYPVRYAYLIDSSGTANDTLVIVTGTAILGLNDATVQSTQNWELVRAGMPRFGGMAGYGQYNQLVGWGDSAGTSILSFSDELNPFDWPVTNDVQVGTNPADPIIDVVGYDDQLVIFKSHNITAYPGFKELSLSDGLVGPRAVVGLNKYLYWLDVDGVKRMARRDFSGYSVEKISKDLDPVFNSWNSAQFGSDISVPFSINPSYRNRAVMVHNQRDQHLYLFFPEGDSSYNTNCLTYGLETGQWDGYFTLPASDAIWATIRDTSRVLMGSPDSAVVTALDYAYNDNGSAIPIDLKSGRWYVSDQDGWPLDARLDRIRLRVKGTTTGSDTLRVIMFGTVDGSSRVAMDTLKITGLSTLRIYDNIKRCVSDRISPWWEWEIVHTGPDSVFNILQPIELQMEFSPVKRSD